jgi:hypothetical protein
VRLHYQLSIAEYWFGCTYRRLGEQRERRSESLAKKRALRMASQASKESAKPGAAPAAQA